MLRTLIEGGPIVEKVIHQALYEIHAEGPVNPATFEKLPVAERVGV